jgi:hypothetical protein
MLWFWSLRSDEPNYSTPATAAVKSIQYEKGPLHVTTPAEMIQDEIALWILYLIKAHYAV